jgi:hypothetical protein
VTIRATATVRLQAIVKADRHRIEAGERPTYHVTWTLSPSSGSTDVRIVELPLIHLFVPAPSDALDGARVLVARTLGTDPGAFEITLATAELQLLISES